MSSVQFVGYLLDRHIASGYSNLTKCTAPDIKELGNLIGSLFLNALFVGEYPQPARSLLVIFLRRLSETIQDYQIGRQELLKHVAALSRTNSVVSTYLSALAHFEAAIAGCRLAISAQHASVRVFDPSIPLPFKTGDGSREERLAMLYDALRHHSDRIIDGKTPPLPAPVWITNEGLCGLRVAKSAEEVVTLSFVDLAEMIEELRVDAEFLAEGIFKVVVERRAQERSQRKGSEQESPAH